MIPKGLSKIRIMEPKFLNLLETLTLNIPW